MEDYSKIKPLSQEAQIAVLAHFHSAVPIDSLQLPQAQKDRVARVEHVYWLYLKNPYLDTSAMFYELNKQRYNCTKGDVNAHHKVYAAVALDERMLRFVIDNAKPHSRKDSEFKVRAATDKLIQIGMQTDNVQALSKGASLRMQLDQLDQPESEHADMNRLSFLPPVVTTSAKDVDDTKEDVNDTEMKRIMSKYEGYVDEKENDIEKMVEVMAAKGKSPTVPAGSQAGKE